MNETPAMRLVVQRVRRASVAIEGAQIAAIGEGLLTLAAFYAGRDPGAVGEKAARKLVNLRLFADGAGKMNRSLLETGGGLLLVPQFTLAAVLESGLRPSFHMAMPPQDAEKAFERFFTACRALCPDTQRGAFREHMAVALENDGPVTLVLDF